MGSWQSFFVERILKLFKKEVDPDTFLAHKRKENESPYVLPPKLQRKYHIIKLNSYSIDAYLMKSLSQSKEKQILYIPGGGYTEQPLFWHWRFLDKLTKKLNGTITVPIYPKAPNHQYQDSFESILPIYKDLLTKASPKDIVIMGDSAGGGLSLALSQLLLKERLPQPGNIILLSPWLDVNLDHPEIPSLMKVEPMLDLKLLIASGKLYAGNTPTNNYLISPINGPIRGLGKITLFIGTHEIFLPDARKLKALAEQENVHIHYFEYPKMNHVFPVFPIPEAKRALQQIVDIINDKIK
ncbi:alpha/beta hydrolase fold domain-containing protein [Anaerotignum propionicum]|uniref:alpha/beta hydrolase fold domain-containing protein n=1 Tax=Anaerotignum propionicum TaxID=28446 RepID=UPI00210ADA0A|nr:alpha/beta hydrolase [Anaerotignum propionicum]MCQ4937333.1 alpha/beta hydrolase [Anaerotignum propionicum]